MKKFIALYMARAATVRKMMKATPEQAKSGMDDWMKWAKKNEKAILELGAPLGKTRRVTSAGIGDTKNQITGYTIVQAATFDGATKVFKGHPHLKMEGTSIDVLEFFPLPGM